MEAMISKTKRAMRNRRLHRVKNLFVDGVKGALSDQSALGTIGAMTLVQGLKYRGSAKAGIRGGMYTTIVLGTLGGIQNVMLDKEKL